MLTLSPVDRVYGHIPVTATLHNGNPATITGVDVAVLRSRPAASCARWPPSGAAGPSS